jgi:hypothetical protein
VEQDRPAVKEAFPVGNTGLHALPEHLDAWKLCQREEFHILNPFAPGLSITRVPASSLNYIMLAQGFIVDKVEIIDKDGTGPEARYRHGVLNRVGEDFWPVAAATFSRLLRIPKRDNGLHPSVSPDMGLKVAPPKRKIDSPQKTRRPGPPTAK